MAEKITVDHFSKNEIEQLAQLARISLSKNEVEQFTTDLNVINEAIEKVSQVASENVPITSHPLPLSKVFRDDDCDDSSERSGLPAPIAEAYFFGDVLTQEEALSGAPKASDGQFVAPQILGE